MRTLLALSLGVSLIGCASSSTIVPNESPSITGVYTLMAVDNQAVPEALPGHTSTDVLGGRLDLRSDGSFNITIQMRTQLSALEPFTYSRKLAGSYTGSRDGLTLAWQDGKKSTGFFFGKTLRVSRDGVEYLFYK